MPVLCPYLHFFSVSFSNFKDCVQVNPVTMSDEVRFIIFDEDMGTDDAWALFLLIKAQETHNIKLLAITCVAGNTSLEFVAII